MTDSDSINPFEAPSQPTISSEPTIGEPILYEATPTIDDLNSALRPVSSLISVSFLLLLMTFFSVVTSINILTNEFGNASHVVILCCTILFALFMALTLFTTLFSAKRYLRLNPNATALLTGELTSEGLRLKSNHSIAWYPHEALKFCQLTKDQVSLRYGSQTEAVKILPMRGFGNPTKAVQFLEFQATQDSTLNPVDPLIWPSKIGNQSADAIAFGGGVNEGDIVKSPMEAIRKRNSRRRLIGLSVVVAVLMIVVASTMNWTSLLIAGAVLLLIAFTSIRKKRSALNSLNSESPLLTFKGWLDEQEIALLNNFGQTRSGWQDFRTVGFNDACIWLRMYGFEDGFVIIPRRFFADETQWQAAVNIVANLPSSDH